MADCKPTVAPMFLPWMSLWGISVTLALAFSCSATAQIAAPAAGPTQAGPALASSAAKAALPSFSVTKPASVPPKAAVATGGPSWAELTASQKVALAPLAGSWSVTVEEQKRKWLEISKNYPRLSPAEQTTMHSRMNEWVAMTPQQRAQARLNFAKTKEVSAELTPDEKKAKWESYQSLSPEEKKGLAATAVAKPAGAATAVKPVAPQKLAVVPKNPAAASSGPISSSSPVSSPGASAAPAAAAAPVANKP